MVETLPFNYLGFSIGRAHNRKEAWISLEEQFKYKIDRRRNVSLQRWQINPCAKIRFWKDSWCEVQPLAENVSHSWNLGLLRNVSDNEFDNVAIGNSSLKGPNG